MPHPHARRRNSRRKRTRQLPTCRVYRSIRLRQTPCAIISRGQVTYDIPGISVALLRSRRFVSLESRERATTARRGSRSASIHHQSALQFRRTKLDRMVAPACRVCRLARPRVRRVVKPGCVYTVPALYANVISTCVATSDYGAVVAMRSQSGFIEPSQPYYAPYRSPLSSVGSLATRLPYLRGTDLS